MTTTAVTIEIDTQRLNGYSDWFLATAWHVAQANPAEFGDRAAAELVKHIGWEIIRRWLASVPPELHHQDHHHHWNHLRRLADYQPPPGAEAGSAEWHRGEWVPKPADGLVEDATDRPGPAVGDAGLEGGTGDD